MKKPTKSTRLQKHERMYVYLWQKLCHVPVASGDGKFRVKFGEHVQRGTTEQKRLEGVEKYIKGSQSYYRIDDTPILGKWDVNGYAAKKGCLEKHGGVDNIIRDKLPGRVGNTEWHDVDDIDEFIRLIEEEIYSKQTPPILSLRPYQYDNLVTLGDMIAAGHRRIGLEWATRYGKTISMLVLGCEKKIPLTIVACYVGTSFKSFRNDICHWKQFKKNFVYIDSNDMDAKTLDTQVRKALKNKKQVVVALSLCPGSRRQSRIDTLFRIRTQRLVIIDEADYGAHKIKQAKPLRTAAKKNDIVIIMTGTDCDKAATYWQLDSMLQTSYLEMLQEKQVYIKP